MTHLSDDELVLTFYREGDTLPKAGRARGGLCRLPRALRAVDPGAARTSNPRRFPRETTRTAPGSGRGCSRGSTLNGTGGPGGMRSPPR